MNLMELMYNRRSIRRYKPDVLSDDIIYELIKAAVSAPSAGNVQPWEFIIIKDQEIKINLAKAAYNQMFIAEAPVVIVVCANLAAAARAYGERGVNLYCIQDTAAAIENVILYAYSKGIGSCWVGAFSEKTVEKILSLPEFIRPVALIPLGYPAEMPEKPLRKPLNSIIHFDSFKIK
ncbi:MAG: nitroreductase family protein [Candidatus Odinarchaeum yellowstonii]|uniref:Nitroreductase family protein n=1 Tax=Odinarchaeota yellowstonii (strain LCB_4) TaxID=1841599 RepID=A0AAF0D1K5_ODILC|nr:MAG: nitroreductase family protein [Candidatus Odinarchaeum yellowstonii]